MAYLTTPFQWVGGKVRMRGKIVPLFDKVEHELYVEPFGGSGAMFFGKNYSDDENEVFNDANGLITNFFRQIRDPEACETIKELARITPTSREFWYSHKDICYSYIKGDTKELVQAIQANNLDKYPLGVALAFAFFYCQQNGFGGTFLQAFAGGIKPNTPGKKYDNGTGRYNRKIENLQDFGKRFKRVVIENVDYTEVFEKYDCEKTLFYCDPPYEGSTSRTYRSGWKREDTNRLVKLCCEAKGSVVLSCYDSESYSPLIDAGFEKKQFKATMSVNRNASQETNERTETLYYRVHYKQPVELEPEPENTLLEYATDFNTIEARAEVDEIEASLEWIDEETT